MVLRQDELIQLSIFDCQWCGKSLPKGRADMKCHKGCRQALYRWKKRQEREVNEALTIIDNLMKATRLEWNRATGIEALKALNGAIKTAYQYNNLKEVR